MIAGAILTWLVLWILAIYVGYEIGGRKSMRYEAVALTIILGLLGLAILPST